MRGDSIVIGDHHRKAGAGVVDVLHDTLTTTASRFGVTIAGESGSGKSEVAAAVAVALKAQGVASVILGQDDYFHLPPKSNDAKRREDIAWVGPQEVKLDLLDQHIHAFIEGADKITKPDVIYGDDVIESADVNFSGARVVIIEGTYTTLLDAAKHHVFIDQDYTQTRKHREKRLRDVSELDPFIDRVLEIEHGIISAHKPKADIIITADYSVRSAP